MLCIASLALSGCATKNAQDPLEPLNRAIFAANKQLDKFVTKPLAIAYDKAVPPPLKTGLVHFFDNIWTIPTIINDLLQLELKQAGIATARFALNSTVGILGLFDVASKLEGLPAHKQDFGHTLERWGYKKSAYFVLPIFGPSTIRDGIGRAVTFYYLTPYRYLHSVRTRNWLMGINFVSDRASFLKLGNIIDEAAVDEYVLTRDIYLQRRENDLSSGTFTIGKESGTSQTTSGETNTGSAGVVLEGPPE